MRSYNPTFSDPGRSNRGLPVASDAKGGSGVEVLVLGSSVPRPALWVVSAAASIVIVGQVSLQVAIQQPRISLMEQDALVVFASIGLFTSVVCALLEKFAAGVLENKFAMLAAGFSVFGAGLGCVLTILFGAYEPLGVVVASVVLAMAGAFILKEPLNSVAWYNSARARVVGAKQKVRNLINLNR
jgi:hypothetical protein